MSILSIDIGGTFIKYALMDKDASILSKGKILTPQDGRAELVRQSADCRMRCRMRKESRSVCPVSLIQRMAIV